MIKKILLSFVIILTAHNLLAQNRPGRPAPAPVFALPTREVSGVVRDTDDNTIIGATITLKSKKDTLRTVTNADGVFVFKGVKQAVFTIDITEVGFIQSIRLYKNNDAVKHIVLEPIILKSSSHLMSEVKINGTPSITYKVDTVEYKASDYKVHANSTVDELLKHMEGFEVGSDGSVTHQGQSITAVKLNGKTYATGDVATAIQNLPADIIEKVQVVDDYGDAAARTGVKDGDPQKVLNLTTRADRSVGITGRVIAQDGNDDRFNLNLFVQRINANQQIGFIGNLRNTVNGVASSGVTGGATNGGGGGTTVSSGGGGAGSGTTKSGSPSFNYRDQWGKKIQVIAGYTYNFRDNNSLNNSYGQMFTPLGPDIFRNNNTAENDTKGHAVNLQVEFTIDSANFLELLPLQNTPTFNYTSSTSISNADQDNVDNYLNAFQHNRTIGLTTSTNSAPNFGEALFYQHLFKKPHRNISLQVSYGRTTTQANGENNTTIHYYQDSTYNIPILPDSIHHYLTLRTSVNTTYRSSLTYVEPFNLISQLEFNAQIRRSEYDNKSITDTVYANGQVQELFLRDNISDYSFTDTRITLNYRYNGVKYNLSLGATVNPSYLAGTKIDNLTGQNVPTSTSYFKVIPVFRFAYSWSRTERFTLTYSGSNNEPTFTEIQPFIDVSNTQHYYYGNPNLSPSYTNSITGQYNNYIANSKLNFSLNVNDTYITNSIVTDDIILQYPSVTTTTIVNGITHTTTKTTSRTDTHYINMDGDNAVVVRYNLSKQLDDRRYNLALNGNITYGYSVDEGGTGNINGPNINIATNDPFHATNWRFDERFGPRINPTENIEINPYIGYDLNRTFTTFPTLGSNPNLVVKTASLAVDGKMYFFKTFQINYSATKSYVTGLGNLATNPLVLNAGFEKEFLEKKNLVLTFSAFDLLHQNNFIQQTITTTSITNTQSNSLSRYFLIGFRLNLQKWSGVPKRNGRDMKRRGDGSFIY